MLSIVQNREERPATRNGGLLFDLRARSERLFLETRSSRMDRRATRTRHVILFSSSLSVDLYVNLFTITSILQCTVNIVPMKEQDMRVNEIDINEQSYSFLLIAFI